MATTTLRARVDSKRKARAAKILKRYGLDLGEAVNVFLAKIEEVNGLPFDLRPDNAPTAPLAHIRKIWDSLEK